jgi:electron transfer flavoprotein beta subunit
VSELEIDGDVLHVTREIDIGLEKVDVDLPAVVTADLRLNEPRYVKLPDIMKAKKKPLDSMAFADLGVAPGPQIKEIQFEPPAEREKGVMVDDVQGLVAALQDKGLV